MKTWHWIALGTGVVAIAAFVVVKTRSSEQGDGTSALARTDKKTYIDRSASAAEISQAYPAAAPVAARLIALARKLGTKPQYIANVINFESRWNPAIVNQASGATGLIQFMPTTAKGLGTTTTALAGMNTAQQFAYVEKYFLGVGKKLPSQIDVFMAVYYPRAIGKSPDWVIGSDRDAEYVAKVQSQNPGIKTIADYAAKALLSAKM